MSKSLKGILFAIIGLIGLFILISVVLYFSVNTGVYKPRLEKAASDALGMEVHVGRVGIGIFPGLYVRLDDMHLRNRGMDIAFAKEARIEIALLSLLHKDVRIRRIVIQHPGITIKRYRDGTFNFETPKELKGPSLLNKLSLSDGVFVYEDEQSGEGFKVVNFELDSSSLRIAGENRAELLKNLAFTAEFACREIQTKGFMFHDVKFACSGKDGIFAFNPVTMRLFGGQGSASIRIDLSVPVPHYSLRTTLSNISIEEFLKTLSSKKVGQGSMSLSASLSMQGSSMAEIKQSARGEVSLHGEHLTLSNANEELGNRLGVKGLTLNVHNLRIAGGNGAELLKNISFTADLTCPEIQTMGLMVSDVRLTCNGKDGIFAFNPVTMLLSGGRGVGGISVDLTGPVPRYSVRASLSEFRIEDYLKLLSSKKVGQGSMNFSANLSMRGNSAAEIKQSAQGEVTLQGENLTLYGYNLDLEFARFESSQNFNLVDAGAFFFAGPLGLAATKGYTFASIFKGSGGSTGIKRLFSDWKVEHGIAQAKDVAMSTRQNRIALKGRINFVNEHFDDVTIALVDARGCARVKQKIHGPFRNPVVEKPSFLMSIAGPALNLLKEARDIFTGGRCDKFYRGSVPAPK